jgi:hypothetical protein
MVWTGIGALVVVGVADDLEGDRTMTQAEYNEKAREIRAKAAGALAGIGGAARCLSVAKMLDDVDALMTIANNVMDAAEKYEREMDALNRRDRFQVVQRSYELARSTDGTGAL